MAPDDGRSTRWRSYERRCDDFVYQQLKLYGGTTNTMTNMKTYPTPADVAAAFATDFADWLNRFPVDKTVTVSLSGGSTPKMLFELWGSQYADVIDWNRIHFFWGDERCVAPDDDESNYGSAKSLWLDKVNIAAANIHRVRGESNSPDERIRYEQEMRKFVAVDNAGNPQFDLMLLGMGKDGHIASIFPNQMELLTTDQKCAVAIHPETGQRRITMTGSVLNASSWVVFLITGSDKKDVLRQVMQRTGNFASYPAAHVAAEQVDFYLDQAARP